MAIRLLILLLLLWLARQLWRLLTRPAPLPPRAATMVACATCSTYIDQERAASALFDGQRRYFCDTACMARYAQGERLDRPRGR
ncbi:MAG: hypothetical protein COW73_00405 [Nitrospirae bacterium CG18_big_fil_WC_8_21_14_2_50_70_55]|nr:hypothetical protein [Deltaproteobacteria bacterium]OIP63505.1 MAG: hypothetical protein AUK30_08340 [Nitrospirae bacterium CG2_30_70_394]PIQ07238.1 MAG: hypothetical protein COW73_00405 [Nitrospirae bacterium CG18_big_fil_WC_8_21_14_2_50_70_55]PIU79115.1 MAG: hypothetical protein COS73_04985 [Nitrospirae bacterium CG06_land_8_20_14_3_00_70_43]PIW83319.1 MAG: hypothetical protein COZ96_03985 [Nitrospirae bacterium CG_4_8_14_3_um_filter_70_85]PIX83412.1 MAG: hypothetical protein COZ33_05635 